MVLDKSAIGRNLLWTRVSWMKLSSFLNEIVLDESVFG